MNMLPRPSSDSTRTVPPNMSCVSSRTTARPMPEPAPGALVVNPASKTRSRSAGAMPVPRSRTLSVSTSPARAKPTTTGSVPPADASTALRTRLVTTWYSALGSP